MYFLVFLYHMKKPVIWHYIFTFRQQFFPKSLSLTVFSHFPPQYIDFKLKKPYFATSTRLLPSPAIPPLRKCYRLHSSGGSKEPCQWREYGCKRRNPQSWLRPGANIPLPEVVHSTKPGTLVSWPFSEATFLANTNAAQTQLEPLTLTSAFRAG